MREIRERERNERNQREKGGRRERERVDKIFNFLHTGKWICTH